MAVHQLLPTTPTVALSADAIIKRRRRQQSHGAFFEGSAKTLREYRLHHLHINSGARDGRRRSSAAPELMAIETVAMDFAPSAAVDWTSRAEVSVFLRPVGMKHFLH